MLNQSGIQIPAQSSPGTSLSTQAQTPLQTQFQTQAPTTLSIPTAATEEGLPNGMSVNPVLSADGNIVVFAARATNLIPGESTNGTAHDPRFDFWQIYAYDRAQNRVERISVTPGGQAGNASSGGSPPAVSADGRFVAFASRATNLVFGDSNNAADVFVRDRQSGQTTRVSVSSGGAQGNRDSYLPAISADGRFVAFVSQANNLVSGDSNNVADVFVHDRQTGQTTRVSVSSGGAQANASAGLSAPAVSADGRFVAFATQANNLVSGDSNNVADVFVLDRQTGQTTRVSVSSDGAQADGPSTAPAISADGRYVAFLSSAGNLVHGGSNGQTHVYLHDRQSATTERISIAHDGALAAGESYAPVISADGRFIAFASAAGHLVPNAGSNGDTIQVYLHDGLSGQIERVSLAASSGGTTAGDPANRLAWRPALGDYGRYIAFESTATNLVNTSLLGTNSPASNDETGSLSRLYLRDRGPQATGAYTLAGQIIGPDGAPVSDLTVTVGRRFPRQATSDSQGRFAVANLPAGHYVVDLDAPDHLTQPEFPQVVTIDATTDPAQPLQVRAYPCHAPSGLDLCTLRPGDVLLALTPSAADWPQVGGTYFTQAGLYVGMQEAGPQVVQVHAAPTENSNDDEDANRDAWAIDAVALVETGLWTGTGVLDWAVVRPQVSATVAQRAADFGRALAADPAIRYGFFNSNNGTAGNGTPIDLADPVYYYDAKLVQRAYAHAGHALVPAARPGLPALAGWITPDDLYHAAIASGHSAQVQRRARGAHEHTLFVWAEGAVRVALVGDNGVRMGYRPAESAQTATQPSTLVPPDYLYSGESARVESLAVARLASDVQWHMEITGVDTGDFVVGRREIAPHAAETREEGTLRTGETQSWLLAELASERGTLFMPTLMR